jgi:hypothetical protein
MLCVLVILGVVAFATAQEDFVSIEVSKGQCSPSNVAIRIQQAGSGMCTSECMTSDNPEYKLKFNRCTGTAYDFNTYLRGQSDGLPVCVLSLHYF